MPPLDPITYSGILLTVGCLVGALALAVLPVFVPTAAESPFIGPLFRLLMFIFSVGAGAMLFRALG